MRGSYRNWNVRWKIRIVYALFWMSHRIYRQIKWLDVQRFNIASSVRQRRPSRTTVDCKCVCLCEAVPTECSALGRCAPKWRGNGCAISPLIDLLTWLRCGVRHTSTQEGMHQWGCSKKTEGGRHDTVNSAVSELAQWLNDWLSDETTEIMTFIGYRDVDSSHIIRTLASDSSLRPRPSCNSPW